MMKKLILIALLLTLPLILIGCSQEDNSALVDKIDTLENGLEGLDSTISEGLYKPGVYHGMSFAKENQDADDEGLPLDYDNVYTASVVVDRNGKIAGVFYDRIRFTTVDNPEKGRLYRVVTATPSITDTVEGKYDIAGAYFIWNDQPKVANDALDPYSNVGEYGTMSQEDSITILSGAMSRETLTYNVDLGEWYVAINMFTAVSYSNVEFDLRTYISNVDVVQQSDALLGKAVLNQELKDQAVQNALDGYEIYWYQGPQWSDQYAYGPQNPTAYLEPGQHFKENTSKGEYVPGVYMSRIDNSYTNYDPAYDSYIVFVIDEYGNFAGSFINGYEKGPVDRNEIQWLNKYATENTTISKNKLEGYYDSDYESERWDVFYYYDKIINAGEEDEYTLRSVTRAGTAVRFDDDFIASDITGMKFVWNGERYIAYTFELATDDFGNVLYEEDGEPMRKWVRDDSIEFIKAEKAISLSISIHWYIPTIEFDLFDSKALNDAILSGEGMQGDIHLNELYHYYFEAYVPKA